MEQIIGIVFILCMFVWGTPYVVRRIAGREEWLWGFRHLLLCIYMLANVKETVLFRRAGEEMKAKWLPLWSYCAAISFSDGMQILDTYLLYEIILNILLFIPLGYLLAFIWPGIYDGHLPRVIGVCLLCSSCTETIQLFGRIGLFEFDDLINNALGGMIGYGLYRTFYKRCCPPGLLIRECRRR